MGSNCRDVEERRWAGGLKTMPNTAVFHCVTKSGAPLEIHEANLKQENSEHLPLKSLHRGAHSTPLEGHVHPNCGKEASERDEQKNSETVNAQEFRPLLILK